MCNYALGVLDKETGVLKMVPIAANRIFRLEPKFEVKEESTKKNKADISCWLTKKDIDREKKFEVLRQIEDPGTQEDMDHKLKGIKINWEALKDITSTDNAQNIPPYNLRATASEMAYPLDKIIFKGEWDYLLDIFELVERGSELSPDVYPSFVCNRVRKFETIKDKSKRKRMAGILSYITHLIKYKDRHSMDGVSTTKRHKLPSILSQKFSSMFGTTKDNKMPHEKQDLLISYVLVLSLFVDDFRSDPSDLEKDLRMSHLTLRRHYKYLGCKLVRENGVLLADLAVPLKFETNKRKRSRK